MPSNLKTIKAVEGYGLQAASIGLNLSLQVLQSAAGFYIGTFSAEEGPVSRESEEYYSSKKEAQDALTNGIWTQRYYF